MKTAKRHSVLCGLALAAWLLPAGLAAAGEAPRLDGWLGAGVTGFDYEETDQDAVLDREEGGLPGLTVGLHLARGAWFAEGVLDAGTGRVDYESATERTETDEDVLDLRLIAGRGVFAQDGRRLGLYAGLGYRHWQRDIRSTPTAFGLDETYRWWYGSLGLRAESRITDRVGFRADFQLRRTLDPAIDVRFRSGQDDITLDLGEANGARAAFTLEGRLDDTVTVFVTPWYEYWKLGRSADAVLTQNGNPVGTVFEPRSETHNLGIHAGVRWRLF